MQSYQSANFINRKSISRNTTHPHSWDRIKIYFIWYF